MRTLILYAGAGTGHRRAAQALEKSFAAAPGGGSDITVVDVLDFTPAVFRRTYAEGYLRLVRVAPELWGYMYTFTDRKSAVPWRRKVRSAFNAINTRSLRSYLSDINPDLVVCTHFMPLELLGSASMTRRCPVPRYCVVTDFAVHSLWIVRNVHGYFVATENARHHLIRRGIDAGRVEVSGIPVDPDFAGSKSADAVRRQLGLAPDVPTVLVMSGGSGVGPTLGLLKAFRDQQSPLQLIVVAGSNKRLRQDAEHLAGELSFPVKVLGFVDHISDLMDAADLVVSKPGGLTASEVMAKGRPLVIVDPIPGQEQRNCEYLLEAGAAIRVYEMDDAASRIRALLADPARLARMRECAQRTGRPLAAQHIVESILRRLPDDNANARAAAAALKSRKARRTT